MTDSYKTIDGFEYWIKNEENGVCHIPLNLCEKIMKLLKEKEPYISKETRLNRDEYCRVGDVLDCFDGMSMKADEVFHAVCLIEWAMSKRSVPLDQLLKDQEVMVKPTKCSCGELFDAKDSSFCPKCGCAYGELSGRYTNIGR